jgi:hypothetical protein
MEETRELIAVFRELNSTGDRNIARLTPSLVGMFGSLKQLDAFLAELDIVLANKTITEPLRKRSINLADTFIPQVAGYNGINELPVSKVTPESLRSIRSDSPESRVHATETILAALMKILTEVRKFS